MDQMAHIYFVTVLEMGNLILGCQHGYLLARPIFLTLTLLSHCVITWPFLSTCTQQRKLWSLVLQEHLYWIEVLPL